LGGCFDTWKGEIGDSGGSEEVVFSGMGLWRAKNPEFTGGTGDSAGLTAESGDGLVLVLDKVWGNFREWLTGVVVASPEMFKL